MPGLLTLCFNGVCDALYQAEFLEGKRLYSADDFSSCIGHFERALEEFFGADAECRALCEGEYDYDGYNYMEYSADLFQSITGERRRVVFYQNLCVCVCVVLRVFLVVCLCA